MDAHALSASVLPMHAQREKDSTHTEREDKRKTAHRERQYTHKHNTQKETTYTQTQHRERQHAHKYNAERDKEVRQIAQIQAFTK